MRCKSGAIRVAEILHRDNDRFFRTFNLQLTLLHECTGRPRKSRRARRPANSNKHSVPSGERHLMQLQPVGAQFLIYQSICAGKKVAVDRITCDWSIPLMKVMGSVNRDKHSKYA